MTAMNKNTIYLPKDALLLDGKVPVKAGKGRMSRAAVDRINELVIEGYQIAGYQSDTPLKADAPVAVKRVPVNNEKVIAEYVIFWDEHAYKAIGKDKKEWSMREACNHCLVSLVQCHCGNPTILGGINVTIVPK